MMFNEKLYKMRKEKNLSQEALAEKLNTTRQAVSKWENNQGFPETERLLMISNFFNVSIDYLLRDTKEEDSNVERGYYVSKEMAEGFIDNQKRWVGCFLFGIAILILSIAVFLKFEYEGTSILLFLGMIISGGLLSVRGLFLYEKKYNVLKKETLIFDRNYLNEIRLLFEQIRKKYFSIIILSGLIFFICIFMMTVDTGVLSKNFISGVPVYIIVSIIILALSFTTLCYFYIMLSSYKLLIMNEEYVSKLAYKLTKKIKNKINEYIN